MENFYTVPGVTPPIAGSQRPVYLSSQGRGVLARTAFNSFLLGQISESSCGRQPLPDSYEGRSIVSLTLRPGRILFWLLLLSLTFSTLGVAVQVLRYIYGFDFQLGFYPLLNVGTDANAPTWYASGLLLYCAVLLALIAKLKSGQHRAFALGWWVLAAIFVLLSVDETARIHEVLGRTVQMLYIGPTTGYFFHAWVIPAMLLLGLLILVYIPFLIKLPSATRWGFLLAGAVYLSGAMGVEMVTANYISRYGDDFTVNLIIVIEETLEMLGAVAFAHTLAVYLASQTNEIRLKIATAPSAGR